MPVTEGVFTTGGVSPTATVDEGAEPYLTPDDYPATCEIPAEELRKLKEFVQSDEDLRCYVEEWPPTDDFGNVYPIWFTVDDLDDGRDPEECRGELRDGSHYFNPWTGNLQPKYHERLDYCNSPLSKWRERYQNIRYCSVTLRPEKGYEQFCYFHRTRKHMYSAEEAMQTGLFAKTVDHVYATLDPLQKLVGWGSFESLMGESTYDFAPEYEVREFDFSDADVAPDGVDEDDVLRVKCGYPTDHANRAVYLYAAAMQEVQMISVQPRIMHEDREAGEGMMESRTIEKAQLTSPTESDPSQEYRTIETWSEHHLNLPFSRLISDQSDLLEMGGVTTDAEEDSTDVDADDIVLEIEADPDGVETADDTGTSPQGFGNEPAQSEQILAKANASNDSDNGASVDDDT